MRVFVFVILLLRWKKIFYFPNKKDIMKKEKKVTEKKVKLQSFIFPDVGAIEAESLEKAQEIYFKSLKK